MTYRQLRFAALAVSLPPRPSKELRVRKTFPRGAFADTAR